MSWSNQFITSLSAPAKIITYSLKFLAVNREYKLSQGTYIGYSTEIKIGEADVVFDSTRITPSRWSVDFGSFTVTIHGDLRPVFNNSLVKGAIAELIMSRDGIQNRVAIGQLLSVSGSRGVWTLQFGDFLTIMRSRATNITYQNAFWYNAGQKATVTTNFNYASGQNLYLDNIDIFEQETGQNGLIHMFDSIHNLDVYWLWDTKTYTSAPAGYLHIVSTGVYPSTISHDHLQAGDTVVSCARLRGRADYVFARLLMSTGDGTQGVFDDYPKSWGLGINWQTNLVDKADMDRYYGVWATSTGTHEINLVIENSGNIRTFLDAILNMGMFPVWRQNSLSWRVAQDPNNAGYITVVDHITDIDIIEIEDHQLYADTQDTIYTQSRIVYYDTVAGKLDSYTSARSPLIYPADQVIERDLSLIYRIDNPSQLVKAQTDIKRLAVWDSKPYENLTISVTEKHAVLVAGDIVEITSSQIYGLSEGINKTYSHRRGMVLSNRWMPSESRCILSIGIMYPYG